jgi:hypothetical protein
MYIMLINGDFQDLLKLMEVTYKEQEVKRTSCGENVGSSNEESD